MGRSFGEGISALLETYAKCLGLLKGFTASSDGDTGSVASQETIASQQRGLRRSIRSDRSRVRDAYSGHLHRRGSRLSLGDAPSRSALRHIVETLKTAIRSILNLAGHSKQPVLDYESLTTLSNISRAEALQTMDDLSRRLQQTSSLSSPGSSIVGQQKQRKGKKSKVPNEPRKRSASSSSSKSSKSSKPGAKRRSRSHENGNSTSQASNSLLKRRHKRERAGDLGQKKAAALIKQPKGGDSMKSQNASERERQGRPNPAMAGSTEKVSGAIRLSMISTSTDSTKLGEIPYRRNRLMRRRTDTSGKTNSTDAGEYIESEFRPTYPYSAFPAPPDKKRGLLRRLLG